MSHGKPEILAVHKQKLEQFLRELQLWDPLLNGELKCVSCGETVTVDNIGIVIPSGENILFCCSKLECLSIARKLREGGQENGI